MTADLETRIARYADQLEARAPRLSVEEVRSLRMREQVATPPPATRWWERRRWLVALASAAAVVLLIGGIAWLLRGEETQPVGTEAPVVTSPVITSSPEEPTPDEQEPAIEPHESTVDPEKPVETQPSASEAEAGLAPGLDGGGWRRLEASDREFAGEGFVRLRSIATGEAGVVVVGTETFGQPGSETHVPAVWVSPDGLEWNRVAETSIEYEGNAMSMRAVAAFGDLLVAGGSTDCQAALWVSDDGGSTWSTVLADDAESGDCTSISHLVAGTEGMLALSFNRSPSQGATMGWISTDAVVWTPVAIELASPQDSYDIVAVAGGGPGFVILGEVCQGPNVDDESSFDRPCEMALWTSTDGAGWTRVALDESVLGDTYTFGESAAGTFGLTAGGPGLVLFGLEGPCADGCRPSIWTSTDASTWTRAEITGNTQPDTGYWLFEAVVTGRDGLVAIGSGSECAPSQDPDTDVLCERSDGTVGRAQRIQPVFVSTDGHDWTRQPGKEDVPSLRPPGYRPDPTEPAYVATLLHSFVLTDSGLVAIGSGPDPNQPVTRDNYENAVVMVWLRE